jgi:hypothetical protein
MGIPLCELLIPLCELLIPLCGIPCARGCKMPSFEHCVFLQQKLAWATLTFYNSPPSLRTLVADSAYTCQHCMKMLYWVSGDLKHLCRGPWGSWKSGQFSHTFRLGMHCKLHLHGVPRKFSQIVLKFGQETDDIMHYSVCYRQTKLSS